ncbi:MAG TPA: asparagine synthase (glutamine-hydrolyzing) [Puia sp.]|nr:asparagine synthase (glutamine-hydrolyzing) [Puia sp.]
MCGIAGLYYFRDQAIEPKTIRGMTGALAHRGPDADGFYDGSQVAFGHRRLSILDLSSAANQPFFDRSGRYVMVFNGELYNYEEVKVRIPEYDFQTTGDTEVLIAAYAKWGPECIHQFRGMFAFAIWDHQEKELFVARDRMGVKPFYYYLDGEKFLFASEIRSILASGVVRTVMEPAALLDYFSYQSIGFPHTMIRNIRQLEAGSWMKIRDGRTETNIYWKVTRTLPAADYSDPGRVRKRIHELLLQSVQRRLISDVPVGAFLSGGIDSSAVVGLMAEVGSGKPNTFNISFDEKEYDESEYAEIVARKFNTRHTRILLRPDNFLDELPHALNAMDTPSGDGINTYVVSKAIRQQGIVVALSGVGGDELFAGYPFFMQYLQLRSRAWLWSLPSPVRSLAAFSQSGSRRLRLQQLLKTDDYTIDKVYPVFRQVIPPDNLMELTTLNPELPSDLQTCLASARAELERLPLLSQVSAAEYMGYTQHTLLKDTDQMSMAVSLEVREPFFDHDLVEFVMGIPDEIKKPVYAKSLMVESLKPLLPDEVVFRKKQGFVFPWELWMKRELRSFCNEKIRNIALRPFVREKELIGRWERFQAGDPQVRWSEIWLFVVLEHWLENNNVTC